MYEIDYAFIRYVQHICYFCQNTNTALFTQKFNFLTYEAVDNDDTKEDNDDIKDDNDDIKDDNDDIKVDNDDIKDDIKDIIGFFDDIHVSKSTKNDKLQNLGSKFSCKVKLIDDL